MTTAPALDVAHYRRLFPILDQKVYLNNCSLGAMPARAAEGLADYARLWSTLGGPAWNTWIQFLVELRELFARFIGAHPHEIAVSPCISTALTTVASFFDYRLRHQVVIADLDFPTIGHQWLARRRQGVEIAWVRSADRIRVPLQAFEAAINDHTALVATSQVFFTSGFVQDVAAIARLAHARGAYCLVDAYQSVGSMPIDVHALGLDFLVAGTLKWLVGGPGIAFLYVREGLIEQLEPTATGWFATKDQFNFAVDRLEFAADATRFQFGTPPVPTAYACRPGMEIIDEVGVDRVQERIRELTRRLLDAAQARGYPVNSPQADQERGGIVMIRAASPQETVRRLVARGFIVDYRPGLVRVSPHFYNTAEEIDRFMEALDVVQGELAVH
jgi:selenocysteine lyase/cysteine desulfurase